MMQFLVLVGFFVVAIAIMAAALHFSQYKKKENSCCGAGNCSTSGGSHDHSCYSSKADFVKNIDIIKAEKINLKN
jgi:hypothetical protein